MIADGFTASYPGTGAGYPLPWASSNQDTPLDQELGPLRALPGSVGRRTREQPQQLEGAEMPARLQSLVQRWFCPQKGSAGQVCPCPVPAFSQPLQEGHLHPKKHLPQDEVSPKNHLLKDEVSPTHHL